MKELLSLVEIMGVEVVEEMRGSSLVNEEEGVAVISIGSARIMRLGWGR